MSDLNKSYFSLVELALGVAILAVATIAVISLIPVGLKENRDAKAKNYVSMATQDIQAYLTSEAEQSPVSFDSLKSTLPTSQEPFSGMALSSSSTLNWLNGPLQNKAGIYSSPTTGIYAVKYYTGDKLDFNAQVNMWTSPVYATTGSGGIPTYDGINPTPGGVAAPQVVAAGGTSTKNTITDGSIPELSPAQSANNIFQIWVDGGTNNPIGSKNLTAGTYMVTEMQGRIMGANSMNLTVNGANVDMSGRNFDITSSTPFSITITPSSSGGNKWTVSGINGNNVDITNGDSTPLTIPGVIIPPSSGAADALGVNVEMSWPIEKPYAKRFKYKYYFEVYKHQN